MNQTSIEISNLTLKFSKYIALDNINLTINKNTFLSIVGPNGAGKSTLLKVILGLIPPGTGTVKIFDKSPDDVPPQLIGYVPQIKTLDWAFPARSIELVATGIKGRWVGRLSKKDYNTALEILEQVGAGHLAKRQLNKLSGGEMQRIYLARALVRKPKLLILDEPATGIDYIGEKDVFKIIDDYKTSTESTILMVTHDWDTAFHHANYVLMLNRKQICFESPEKAFTADYLRQTFGHVGHKHDMIFGEMHHE